ncbi:NUDIX domain-containing protein [bacterium]|nr:NUDIX domain-containing protein [bacterium]MBT5014811.1 NUDIX domain-containing protein [bacterium]
MEDKSPRIGIGVIGYNSNNQILLGKRKNTHGEGDWAVPGGHLEFGETPIECAIRELKEETGLDLEDPQEIMFTNDFFDKEDKHYVTIFVQGFVQGEPKLLEPNRCEKWDWFTLESLPSPLFKPFKSFVEKLNS